jgi:hypothetical protein
MVETSHDDSGNQGSGSIPRSTGYDTQAPADAPRMPLGPVSPDGLIAGTQISEDAMLEVHPPHQTVHTWKDFFIHLATISIGLLIAIGLEQSVEYFHHRHQAAEMAAKLIDEGIENRKVVAYNLAQYEGLNRAMQANIVALLVVKASASPKPFSLTPLPTGRLFTPGDSAWITVRDSALLPIVPTAVVENYWKLELIIQRLIAYGAAVSDSWVRLNSLLNVHGASDTITPAEAGDLLLAFSSLREQLARLHSMTLEFEKQNNLAIDNKIISIESSIFVLPAGGDTRRAPTNER